MNKQYEKRERARQYFMQLIKDGFRAYDCYPKLGRAITILSKKPITKRDAQRLYPLQNRDGYKYVVKNTKSTYFDVFYVTYNGEAIYEFYYDMYSIDYNGSLIHRLYISGRGGYIAAWELNALWKELSQEEQNAIWYYAGIQYAPNPHMRNHATLTKGAVRTKTSPIVFLGSVAARAISDKHYMFARKLIEYAEDIEYASNIDLHYMYEKVAGAYYKQRDADPRRTNATMLYLMKDVLLFPQILEDGNRYTQWPSFKWLAIIQEKEGDIQAAIDTVEWALDYGLEDGTRGGFEGRLIRLVRKLNSNLQ